MHTRNPDVAHTGVYGTGRSLAASCRAGIDQPVALAYCAVPASENAVAEAATPQATRTAPVTVTRFPTPPRERPRRPPPVTGDRASRPAITMMTPPMNMTCAIATSGATW